MTQAETVQLYNKTKWGAKLLRRLLKRTARLAGARFGQVPVKVTAARSGRVSGEARSAGWVAEWHLRGSSLIDDSRVSCDGGFMRLVLPPPAYFAANLPHLAVKTARRIYEIAIHEWVHIADMQEGGLEWSVCGASGRRPAWEERPEEQRARDAAEEAMENLTAVDQRIIDAMAEALCR